MALKTPAFNDAKTYGFEWIRLLLEATGAREGILRLGDFALAPAAAGALRLDIAAGIALLKGDSGVPGTGVSQGLFLGVNDASVANAVTLAAANVTNPRIDRIILKVRDSSDLASGADDLVFDKVTGTATAGATLANLAGVGAEPNDALTLGFVLVPASATSLLAANIGGFYKPWDTSAGAVAGAPPRYALGYPLGNMPSYLTSKTANTAGVASGVDVRLAADVVGAHDQGNLLKQDAGNPGAMLCRVPGFYRTEAQVTWALSATGVRKHSVRVAGTRQRTQTEPGQAGDFTQPQVLSVGMEFGYGDVVDVAGYQSAGGPLDLQSSTVHYRFTNAR